MAVATFDTLKFANTLKAAGDKQAEAQEVPFAEVIQVNFKDLVTKDDLKVTEGSLKHEIRESEQRLKTDINVLRWMIGVVGFGILSIVIRVFMFRGAF